MSDIETKVTEEQPKTALERLDTMEQLLNGLVRDSVATVEHISKLETNLGEALMSVVKEVTLIKRQQLPKLDSGLKELGQYVGAIERVLKNNTVLSRDTVTEALIANAVESMVAQIKGLLEAKIIQPAEVTTPSSLVVFRELDQGGKVVNPRGQFGLDTLDKKYLDLFVGKKVSDVISVVPERSLEIMEIYELVAKKDDTVNDGTAEATSETDGESAACCGGKCKTSDAECGACDAEKCCGTAEATSETDGESAACCGGKCKTSDAECGACDAEKCCGKVEEKNEK